LLKKKFDKIKEREVMENKGEKNLETLPEAAEFHRLEANGFLQYLRKKINFSDECSRTAQSPEAIGYYLNQKKVFEDLMKQVRKYLSQEEYRQFSFEEKLKNRLKSLGEILKDEDLDDEERQIAISGQQKVINYCREFEDFKNRRSVSF